MRDKPTLVLKFGGSVLTDRSSEDTLQVPMVEKFIRKLITLRQALPEQQIVIVLGGGSYGHVPVDDHALDHRNEGAKQYSRLTLGLYRLLSDFLTIGYELGLEMDPFQSNNLFVCDDGQISDHYNQSLIACLANGGMPVLTGGAAYDKQHGQLIYGSDRIVSLLAKQLNIRECLYICDCPGIYQQDRTTIFERVTPKEQAEVVASFYSNDKLDVTGSMLGKFEAAVEFCNYGSRAMITSMDAFIQASWPQIVAGDFRGTVIEGFSEPLNLVEEAVC